MKINWMSNAPWANTGYGNQTRVNVPRLQELGHEMAVTAFYGLEGAILNWAGIPVYPKGRDVWGNDVGAAHTAHFGGKVLISLIDAWVLEPDMLQLHGVRWVPWFPVDMEPLPPAIARKIKRAYKRIVFSRFGEKMVNDAGFDCYYVPHGIDTKMFFPMDEAQVETREHLGLPKDAFIFGTVAANKGNPSRKAMPEMLEAFARFKQRHNDAVLYMHSITGANGHNNSVNLPELAEYLGLVPNKDIFFPDQYQMLIGYKDEFVNALYNAFDVFYLPSMGEGFGLPIMEAQAAGCPVLVGDWTACGELCKAGWKMPKETAAPWYTPLGAYQFKPNVDTIVEYMEMAYNGARSPELKARATKAARQYDADRVAQKYWKPVLCEIEEQVARWAK